LKRDVAPTENVFTIGGPLVRRKVIVTAAPIAPGLASRM
jgi:hypothetical protein